MGDETTQGLSAQEKHDTGQELTDADVRELEHGETPTADTGGETGETGETGDGEPASVAPVAPASGTGNESNTTTTTTTTTSSSSSSSGELSDEERVHELSVLERLEADARAVRERLFGTRGGGAL